MPRIALLIVPVLLAGCATDARFAEQQRQSDAASLARLIDDRVPGPAQTCLDPRRTRGFEAVGASTVIYFDGDTLYRNDLVGACQGLRRDDILVTQSPSTQLCRGDIIRTVDRTSGFPTGGCAFGDFVPYRRPES